MCNNIVSLIHGTTDMSLKNILETNQIEAKKSSMGLNVAVSTYPILDCDLDHTLNLSEFWGTCKIFLNSSLLMDKIDWQLSIESDVSADWRRMPYNHTNISEYMPIISRNRSSVWWSDHRETDTIKLYGGELSFKSSLENIRNYILFVAINDKNPELIQYVMELGINVIIFHDNVLTLNSNWFRFVFKLDEEQRKLEQLLPTLYVIAQRQKDVQTSERQIMDQKRKEQQEKARIIWETIIDGYGEDYLQQILGNTYNIIQRAYNTNNYSLIFRIERVLGKMKNLKEYEMKVHKRHLK